MIVDPYHGGVVGVQVIFSPLLCDLDGKVFCYHGHPHSSEEMKRVCENYHYPPLVRGMIDPERFLRSQEAMKRAALEHRYKYSGS